MNVIQARYLRYLQGAAFMQDPQEDDKKRKNKVRGGAKTLFGEEPNYCCCRANSHLVL